MRGSDGWVATPLAIWLLAALLVALVAPAWLGWFLPTFAPVLLVAGLLRRAP